jgi:hypothetical protein
MTLCSTPNCCWMRSAIRSDGVEGFRASQKHARTDDESKGDGITGAPQLEPRETGAVNSEGWVKSIGAPQKHVRIDD